MVSVEALTNSMLRCARSDSKLLNETSTKALGKSLKFFSRKKPALAS
ncbi:hypothetical protein EVA_16929 [gut metagenome]|uniref:Uncharacterized protein n=1 Tax=gut metagenome TaxID=749906 RepID=J9C571_9ZZZZ